MIDSHFFLLLCEVKIAAIQVGVFKCDSKIHKPTQSRYLWSIAENIVVFGFFSIAPELMNLTNFHTKM